MKECVLFRQCSYQFLEGISMTSVLVIDESLNKFLLTMSDYTCILLSLEDIKDKRASKNHVEIFVNSLPQSTENTYATAITLILYHQHKQPHRGPKTIFRR